MTTPCVTPGEGKCGLEGLWNGGPGEQGLNLYKCELALFSFVGDPGILYVLLVVYI